ncbi:hypothetical protein F1559_003924 [Cyanidiococcus yangmingshanensis]|uniref:Uncharacterized protein n=1 Tax=Cyanidiococcus yangmingshanensis TaxID=2690220 RepID=A0A7J7IJ27_9RHOD|nr:hypothetical protein F1559_003924 [Cyanidiococcus yangmingshanensis]
MQQLSESSDAAQSSTAWKSLDVIFTSVAYVALSVVNRVAYRMSLQIVPAYTFPLSLFVTMCYVLVYSCILSLRVRSRVVPISQVEWALRNWPLFASIGTLEAATFVIGMFSASRLPGALLPVLNQGILLFIAIASYVLLGRRYTSTQILGLIVVLIGVMLSIGPQAVDHAASDLSSGGIWVNALLFFGSYAFVAIAVVLKERVFKRSGLQPDLFIVNTFSSIMQFLATSITLPFVLTFATQIAGSSSTKAIRQSPDALARPWLRRREYYLQCDRAALAENRLSIGLRRGISYFCAANDFGILLAAASACSIALLANGNSRTGRATNWNMAL